MIMPSCTTENGNSDMPACLIRGVRSVELVATNLDEAARFYEEVWGLAPVATAQQ